MVESITQVILVVFIVGSVITTILHDPYNTIFKCVLYTSIGCGSIWFIQMFKNTERRYKQETKSKEKE